MKDGEIKIKKTEKITKVISADKGLKYHKLSRVRNFLFNFFVIFNV